MPLSSKQRTVGIVAGWLGALQGTAFFIMNIICLVCYYQGVTVDPYSGSFKSAVYLRFLDQDATFSSDVTVTPKAFTAFMWLYLIIDFSWAVLSLNQVYDIKKEGPKLSKSLKSYVLAAILISAMDLILVIGIGIDYGKGCTDNVSTMPKTLCQNAMILMLVIVAKGIVLWLANVIFAYIIYKSSKLLKREEEQAEIVESVQNTASEQSSNEIGNCTVIADTSEDNDYSVSNVPQYGYRYRWCTKMEYSYQYTSRGYEYVYGPVYGYHYEYGLLD